MGMSGAITRKMVKTRTAHWIVAARKRNAVTLPIGEMPGSALLDVMR